MARITENSKDEVKVTYNIFLPLPGFQAMMLFGRIFARRAYASLSDATIRHELIHAAQAVDCGGWFAYYLSYLKYFIRSGYCQSPFEREAYRYMYVADYLDRREHGAWRRFIEEADNE